MNDYRLSDLLDLTILQKMADTHYRAANMPIGIIDAIDNSILVGAGWQDICLKFHRTNPVSLRRCQESDSYVKGNIRAGEPCGYKCKNGLWDIGIPIVVEGRHLATLFLGQFFYEDEIADREFFIRQAHELGFDVDEYLAALDRVPVFSREKVDYILEYDKALVSFIADLAEHSLAKIKADEMIRESEERARERLEERVQAQTVQVARLAAVVESATEPILITDSYWYIEYVNPAFMALTGYTSDESLGKELRFLRPAQESAEKYESARDEARVKGSYRGQLVIETKEGAPVPIDATFTRVYSGTGAITGYVMIWRDMREKLKLEEHLRQSQKMQAIGTLAGGIAHDFNNILAVIIGNSELAIDDAGIDREVRGNLQQILKASLRGRDLVRQILTFSQKTKREPRTIDLVSLVRECGPPSQRT